MVESSQGQGRNHARGHAHRRALCRARRGQARRRNDLFEGGEKILIIDHTGVPDELGGMGVGKALVEHMVMDVRARGLKIIPLCPFTRATLQQHKEWQDILKDPF